MGSKNEWDRAFQMAKKARRYQYQFGTATFFIMGTSTN